LFLKYDVRKKDIDDDFFIVSLDSDKNYGISIWLLLGNGFVMFFPMPARCHYDDNGSRCHLDMGHMGIITHM